MSSYTKCADKSCPSRKSCYRYTGQSGQRQSYADFNREDGKDRCENFLDNNNVKEDSQTV